MMTEISLNVLDIAENSAKAGASLVTISIAVNPKSDKMTVIIEDNGCGMSEEEIAKVTDPFFTSRTTRKVGLGVPFFQYAAECTGGSFRIQSEPGKGTVVTAVFVLSHIDRMPLGDISETIYTLITCHPDIDFLYRYSFDEKEFSLDTRQMKEILGGVPLDEPEVASFIRAYLTENKQETDGGAVY